MVFSSFVFLIIFLPLTVVCYYLLDRRLKNFFLLAASMVFYAWGQADFLPVMLISILINYIFGLLADRARSGELAAAEQASARQTARGSKKRGAKAHVKVSRTFGRLVIALMAVWNISLFFVYKYLDFTIENINGLFGCSVPAAGFVLPIGISFFTFQAMSYVIDVYRGKGQVQKNPLYAALYIMLFPQLIAGPIVRYETVADEILNRKENIAEIASGIKRFIVGLGKKVLIADMAGIVAEYCFKPENIPEISVCLAWFGAICYTLQIFFDFSGYSDMAIGLGLMFGFHFEENFNYPYCSASVSEFWRRWHISLGTWFRDYVYFPLGGSRVKTKARLALNLFVTWMLTGIWHGASWSFVAWGFMYAVLIILEKLTDIPRRFRHTYSRVLYRIFTLLYVIFGWVIFRAPGMRAGASYLGAMFGLNGNALFAARDMVHISSYFVIVLIGVLFSLPTVPYIKKKLSAAAEGKTALCAAAIAAEKAAYLGLFVLILAFMAGSTYNAFIYFNF